MCFNFFNSFFFYKNSSTKYAGVCIEEYNVEFLLIFSCFEKKLFCFVVVLSYLMHDA